MGAGEELPLHGGLDCVEFWRALLHLAGQPGPSIVKSPSHGGPGWAGPQLEAPRMADQAKSLGVGPRSHQFAWCRPGSTYCRDSGSFLPIWGGLPGDDNPEGWGIYGFRNFEHLKTKLG
jgi:hypothetical protein